MGRPPKKPELVRDHLLTIRLTELQDAYLNDCVERVLLSTGLTITKSACAAKLLECGREAFERQFPVKKHAK